MSTITPIEFTPSDTFLPESVNGTNFRGDRVGVRLVNITTSVSGVAVAVKVVQYDLRPIPDRAPVLEAEVLFARKNGTYRWESTAKLNTDATQSVSRLAVEHAAQAVANLTNRDVIFSTR